MEPKSTTKSARRSRKQTAADEHAITLISQEVKTVDRWDNKALREALDKIGDHLVEAGRL